METKRSSYSRTQLFINQLDEFMRDRYVFRKNLLKGDTEYRCREMPSGLFEPVNEEAVNSICIGAQAAGIEAWDRDIKRFIYSARTQAYNPIEDFLDNLPAWDGKDRIRPLAETLPTANPLWREQFYIWFLGMVAQWQQQDTLYGNCIVPLLVGPQGCGKSTWCRTLLPPVLREYMAESPDIGNHREAELALGRFVLVNLDEFDSIGNTQQAFLKHLLRKPVVNTRMAYARSIRTHRRYATFIATCNNWDLLADPTGSRRFVCIEINGNIRPDRSVEYGQLYAQAVAALRAGERYWFTTEEETRNMQNNSQFQQMPIEEQLFLQYFCKPEEGFAGEWLPSSAILLRMREQSGVRLGNTHMGLFGRILLRNGIAHKHTKRGNLWFVANAGQRQTVEGEGIQKG